MAWSGKRLVALTVEPLLLGQSDQAAILEQAGRGVVTESVDPKDAHLTAPLAGHAPRQSRQSARTGWRIYQQCHHEQATPDALLSGSAMGATKRWVPWPSNGLGLDPRATAGGRAMSEAIGQPGRAALPRPMGIGEILGTAFQLYQRHWRTLVAIAAVVVVPFTLLQYLLGDQIRSRGEVTSNGVVIETATWAVGIAGLVAALGGVVMFLVLTGAITRAVAAEVAGEDPGVEQSYRFGFHRFWSVLLVSVLVGLAIIGGLILFIIPGIYIGVRLAVSIEALVIEGRRGTQAMGRSWELVGGHWWHAFGTLVVAGLLTGVVNAVITAPFGNTSWFVQAVAAAVATVVTLPYGVLVGVLLYLDLRARKENLTLEQLRTDLQASAT
jgi:hypothetical protein